MARVLTNSTALQYSVEKVNTPGTLDSTPTWYELQPNSYGTIGASLSVIARTPISKNRQNEKGTITDLDSTASFELDVTLSHFDDFVEGFMFSNFVGATSFRVSGTETTHYAVATGIALAENTLVYVKGMTHSANNGLKLVGTGSTETQINVPGLVIETAPAGITLYVVGFQFPSGVLSTTVASGNPPTVTIASTGTQFNNDGLGLSKGMGVYFPTGTNGFTTGNGFARIVRSTEAGNLLVLDKFDSTWANDSGSGKIIRMFVGRFIRNVATDAPDFSEKTYQFEITYPGLADGNMPAYEYSTGNFCNTLVLAVPITSKATMTPSFVGIDYLPPTSTRKNDAEEAIQPLDNTAFNTTSDIGRLRVLDVDNNGVTSDFKSFNLTLNNNVGPEKVIGILGSKFVNYGNFSVSLESQVVFSSPEISMAVRDNTTLSFDYVLHNGDGAILGDIPSMTVGGGGKDFPANESVLLNMTANAFRDSAYGYTISFTLFQYLPE